MTEFATRRRQLMRMVGQDSVIILPAARHCLRSADVHYPFRQSSDFMYLSGFPEPDAVLVLLPGREQGECLLFCRERDPDKEIWDGRMIGLQRACDEYGMDDAFPIDDIDDILPNLLGGRARLFYTIGRDREFDQRVLAWVARVRSQAAKDRQPPQEFVSLDHYLHDLRLFKSRDEIASLSQAARIAGKAHRRAMQVCRAGMTEYQLAAELLHTFHYENAQASYLPIVGGGANACILHYTENCDALHDGDLVLIDAGAEYDYYASDITRTFPVNGRFSAEQRALYEVVLQAQTDAIEQVRPGCSWDQPHQAAVRTITQGLIDLGLLNGALDECVDQARYRPFYMHKTGHWLGMDVHDVGDYRVDGHARELEPGMVMTVEPGIYLHPQAEVESCWQGLAVRIEDDVLVTRDGHRVLSEDTPKKVDEIEALMSA